MTQCVMIFGLLFLLAVAAFFGFGFMAMFEPSDNDAQFVAIRNAYAIVGIGCLVGVALQILRSIRR